MVSGILLVSQDALRSISEIATGPRGLRVSKYVISQL
jgi:hypothetical protein